MDGEKYEVRNMLFLEEDRRKELTIGKDKFIIQALFPKDKKEIARRVSIEQNGLPANSFSADSLYYFERGAAIDQAIVESPEWWKNSESCPDEEFLDKLYREIADWTTGFQEKLKKNKLSKRSSKGQVSD